MLWTSNKLNTAGVPFSPPSINAYVPGKFDVPEYVEYNLQVQRELNKSTAIIINYTGNYGYHEILQNPLLNASDNTWNQSTGAWTVGPAGSFAGLDAAPADPSFTKTNSYTNNGHSNYNGGWVSIKHSGNGLTFQVSYTYSHAMDTISNGGVGLGYNAGATSQQLTPNLSQNNLNYSNADYDIRNDLTGDMVYVEKYKAHNAILNSFVGGWTLGAKTYYRSGQPFSITNGNLANDGYSNLAGTFMVQKATGLSTRQLTNTSASNPHQAVVTSALRYNDYLNGFAGVNGVGAISPQVTFGDMRRNSLYGPHYANTDMSLLKTLYKREAINLEIGANAYNIFNHANFANPNGSVTSKNGASFGNITGTLAPPTSPYGSFQGAAVTQRVLQVHGKFVF
jgi:hypothetical protein